MEASKKQLIKELREYLDKAEKDETTYCELLMEIPELLKGFNCDVAETETIYTYGEIYKKFINKYPKLAARINDYRPAKMPKSITVWLNVNDEEKEVEIEGHIFKTKKNVLAIAVQYIPCLDDFVLLDEEYTYMGETTN